MMNTKDILARLSQNGHEALIVGGAVRDIIMGLQPNDYDIATSASPDEIITLFSGRAEKIDLVGATFGVVIIDGIEVATFRGDIYSLPGKPEVYRVSSFKEDAARRDFTINALGMTAKGEIIDPFGGQADIANKIIRAVGNPEERFREDPCRLLRAVTFAARFGFTIEAKTADAIIRMAHLAETLPAERVGKELKKALDRRVLAQWLRIAANLGLVPYILPELAHLQGLPQNPAYHDRDAWEHTIAVVADVEKAEATMPVVLAAVFHDCAKGLPEVRKGLSDYGHEVAGVPIARRIIIRLGFGSKIANKVAFLVANHMIRPAASSRSVLRVLRKMTNGIKNKRELQEMLQDLFVLLKADARGCTRNFAINRLQEIAIVQKITDDIVSKVPLFLNELPINGEILIKQGLKGQQIGATLKKLLFDAQSRALASC